MLLNLSAILLMEILVLNHVMTDICQMIAILVVHVVLMVLALKLMINYVKKLMDLFMQMLDAVN
jgi:hypothetical protein